MENKVRKPRIINKKIIDIKKVEEIAGLLDKLFKKEDEIIFRIQDDNKKQQI